MLKSPHPVVNPIPDPLYINLVGYLNVKCPPHSALSSGTAQLVINSIIQFSLEQVDKGPIWAMSDPIHVNVDVEVDV